MTRITEILVVTAKEWNLTWGYDMLTLEDEELRRIMVEAARLGAVQAMDDMICYHLKDAAERLGISYNTLQKRIAEGKIRPIDGRITGAELRRYLTEHRRNT